MIAEKQQTLIAAYADRYPPLLTFQQAVEIAQSPLGTIYDWSSRGHFDSFKIRRGRSCRLIRDEFVRWLMQSSNS